MPFGPAVGGFVLDPDPPSRSVVAKGLRQRLRSRLSYFFQPRHVSWAFAHSV